jgi:hypothetical protein
MEGVGRGLPKDALGRSVSSEGRFTCRVAMGWSDILEGVGWKLREAVETTEGLVKRSTAGAIAREASRVESATRGMKAMSVGSLNGYIGSNDAVCWR